MVTCPACGKENEDSAYECKRCRAPLREEEPQAEAVAAPQSLGEICRHCEAYNEPGVTVCTNCGLALVAGPGQPDTTPPSPFTPPSQLPETLSEELRALAISDEEAAEAGLTLAARNGNPADTTPPEPFAMSGLATPAPASRPRVGDGAAATGTSARRPPPAPPPASSRMEPPPEVLAIAAALPSSKPCASCGARNPRAAKFCFDCGTPFAKKPSAPPPPSIEIAADLGAETFEDATMQSAPVPMDEPVPAESVAEPMPEEQPPPFAARLVLETGEGNGTEFALGHLENSLGGSAAHIGLGDDPHVAPHAATVAFLDERLVLRDEGSANGVYVKVRESAPLEAGDFFIAGERLLRYDGPVDVSRTAEGDPPLLGAPRPGETLYRVAEVLLGAKTGRTCHRAPPAISIGRTGCDMNFGDDTLLAARHAEVHIDEDGATTLVDLGEGPSGVFLRVRPQQPVDLQGGDVVRVGDHRLRVEVG